MPGKKVFFVFAFALAAFVPVFSQTPARVYLNSSQNSFWLALEQGKRFFRQGEYGEALRCFEDAREKRRLKFAGLEREFISVLSIHTVRLLKDDLFLVEAYIKKENRNAAAAALEELYYYVSKDRLRNSAQKALEELGRLKEYPDAEYWIGEVYEAEGEYGIAVRQYQKAYASRERLEIPDLGLTILYKIANIHNLRREYANMEKQLEEILKTDGAWNRESFNRSAMINSAASNGLDRFLVLYRSNNPHLEKAHRLLGLYYYASARYNRALEHLLAAFLIQNTVIIEKLKQEQYNYTFASLDQLLNDVAASGRSTRGILEAYMNETEYFRVMYYLANSFYGDAKQRAAVEIWNFLAARAPSQWSVRARDQLARPRLDALPENIRTELTNQP